MASFHAACSLPTSFCCYYFRGQGFISKHATRYSHCYFKPIRMLHFKLKSRSTFDVRFDVSIHGYLHIFTILSRYFYLSICFLKLTADTYSSIISHHFDTKLVLIHALLFKLWIVHFAVFIRFWTGLCIKFNILILYHDFNVCSQFIITLSKSLFTSSLPASSHFLSCHTFNSFSRTL